MRGVPVKRVNIENRLPRRHHYRDGPVVQLRRAIARRTDAIYKFVVIRLVANRETAVGLTQMGGHEVRTRGEIQREIHGRARRVIHASLPDVILNVERASQLRGYEVTRKTNAA